MANVLHFSEKVLKKLRYDPPEKRQNYSDSVERGLRIEVMPSGSIRFFARRRVKGIQKTFSPGGWPGVSVKSARLWFQNLRADLNRKVVVQDTSQGKALLSEFFDDDYLVNYLKIRASKSWKSESSLFDRHIRDELGRAKLCEIERNDVVSLHNRVLSDVSGRTANRAKILIHRIFNYAIDSGEIGTGNPATRIKNHKEGSRDRFLMEHEMPRFFSTLLSGSFTPQFCDYVLLSLFTGGRQANVLAMRKSNLIPGLPTWRIPADEFKGARVHFVPLVLQAASIANARMGIVTDNFLFPAHSASGHMTSPKKPWAKLCKDAGLKDLRMHDLRATLATWAEDMGVPETIRGKMLGHKDGGVIARYSRSTIQTVQQHFQPVADAIEDAAVEKTKIINIKDAQQG